MLGAAGAVEAIATIEAIRHSFVPKTAGTKELSDYIEANVVYGEGQEADIQYAISNTFGFGGHNAVLAFKRWEGKFMNISEIKDLLAQFDASTLREFSYKNNGEELNLSKNQTSSVAATPVAPAVEVVATPQTPVVAPVVEAPATPAVAAEPVAAPAQAAEGDVVESPLVGVAYLSPAPDKPAFVSVGD